MYTGRDKPDSRRKCRTPHKLPVPKHCTFAANRPDLNLMPRDIMESKNPIQRAQHLWPEGVDYVGRPQFIIYTYLKAIRRIVSSLFLPTVREEETIFSLEEIAVRSDIYDLRSALDVLRNIPGEYLELTAK